METNPAPTDEQRALAHELFEQFAHLGHLVKPNVRNASHGAMSVVRTLHLADVAGEEPLTPSVIAERSRLTPARVANVLRALEKKGWVRREHATDDRRRVTVTLTETGEAERARRRSEVEEQAAVFFSRLGNEDAREAVRILTRCTEILQEAQGEERGR